MAESKAFSGARQVWGNQKAKKGIIVFSVIGIVVLGITFAMSSRNASKLAGPPASAKVVAPPMGQQDVTGRTQENYKELVREADTDRAQQARNTSNTAMVLPRVGGMADPDQMRREEAERSAERGKAKALEQSAAATSVQTSAQAAGIQQIDPNAALRSSDAYRVTLALMQRVASQTSAAATPLMPIYPPAESKQAATQVPAAPASGAPGTPGSAVGGAIAVGVPLIRAGEILFATTDVATNSDFSGPVIATIRQGKFNGARLIGQKQLEHEAVVVRFTSLSPADGGSTYPIQAYAVSLGDAKSFGVTGLAGETDYHMFERYILPGAASFVQALGLSASQKGTTAVVGNNGVGTTTPGLTEQDRVAVALGASMNPLVNDMRQRGSRPVTVSLQGGTEIGVMFGSDVFNPTTQRANAAAAPAAPAVPQLAFQIGADSANVRSLQAAANEASVRADQATAAALQQYQAQGGGAAVSAPYAVPAYGATNYGAR